MDGRYILYGLPTPNAGQFDGNAGLAAGEEEGQCIHDGCRGVVKIISYPLVITFLSVRESVSFIGIGYVIPDMQVRIRLKTIAVSPYLRVCYLEVGRNVNGIKHVCGITDGVLLCRRIACPALIGDEERVIESEGQVVAR